MRLFPFVLMGMMGLSACGSSKKSETSIVDPTQPNESSHYLNIAVNVDGKLSEWPEPLPGYSKETTLHFGVTNNNQFLFIAVASSESQVQQKMLHGGMEVYISENGKKETGAGIVFPVPSKRMHAQTEVGDANAMPGQNGRDFKKVPGDALTQLETFGLKKSGDSTYALSSSNVKAAYSWGDNNFFSIEYAIPLNEVFANAADFNNKAIQVGLKLNAFGSRERIRPAGGSAAANGGGMRGGGMRGGGMGRGGGMHGGGMRQNGSGFGTNSNAELAKDQSFWSKYTLSVGK